MLVYLDNAQSVAPKPGENYARELLELHTLGVAAGYTHGPVVANWASTRWASSSDADGRTHGANETWKTKDDTSDSRRPIRSALSSPNNAGIRLHPGLPSAWAEIYSSPPGMKSVLIKPRFRQPSRNSHVVGHHTIGPS